MVYVAIIGTYPYHSQFSLDLVHQIKFQQMKKANLGNLGYQCDYDIQVRRMWFLKIHNGDAIYDWQKMVGFNPVLWLPSDLIAVSSQWVCYWRLTMRFVNWVTVKYCWRIMEHHDQYRYEIQLNLHSLSCETKCIDSCVIDWCTTTKLIELVTTATVTSSKTDWQIPPIWLVEPSLSSIFEASVVVDAIRQHFLRSCRRDQSIFLIGPLATMQPPSINLEFHHKCTRSEIVVQTLMWRRQP